ncbi:MAG: heavy-metal-associated domain-containing protein, partial [Sphingomonadaceae bacterium]|nr:heavy-metal-associated domain-containing protein [Sphingomonadaceae bacterium]
MIGKGPAVAVLCAVFLGLGIVGTGKLIAQIEGDRGIPPVASSKDIHVPGIPVNVTSESGEKARQAGWRLAQRKAWATIDGPKMSDDQLDGLVSAVVIEREQIGPRRYIAQLGIIFDRAKAGKFIKSGGGPASTRSAPLLVIPVLYSGGV